MPVMQLRTLVLPAPFGPISANSSARSTLNDTSVSTARPPNRSDRCSIASSAIPALRSRLVPQRAVAAPLLAARLAKIGLLNLSTAAQVRSGALQNDAPSFKHVGVIGESERHSGVLLDQQHG